MYNIDVHSKNTRVSVTRKRVHWGQTPFRVKDDPEISQLDAKYDPDLGQSDPIICQFDWFPGHRWPGMEFGPNGPFSGLRLTRVFLECRTCCNVKFTLCLVDMTAYSQSSGPRFESAGSGSIVPLGEALYPHCLVPRKGLKAIGPLVTCS